MRVLIIDTNDVVQTAITTWLEQVGIKAYCAEDADDGVDLAKAYDYDIICLSTALDISPGRAVLKKIRDANVTTPVLSYGPDDITDKIEMFKLGSDDYLVKPFHREELTARINAIVRRSRGHATSAIKIGNITVDLIEKRTFVNDKPVHLTDKEYRLMEVMSLRKGVTLTKEMLLTHLYGGMDEPELKIIDVFVCKMRKKLKEANGGVDHIHTIWGRGYAVRDDAR